MLMGGQGGVGGSQIRRCRFGLRGSMGVLRKEKGICLLRRDV